MASNPDTTITWNSFVKGYAEMQGISYWQAVQEAGDAWLEFKAKTNMQVNKKKRKATAPTPVPEESEEHVSVAKGIAHAPNHSSRAGSTATATAAAKVPKSKKRKPNTKFDQEELDRLDEMDENEDIAKYIAKLKKRRAEVRKQNGAPVPTAKKENRKNICTTEPLPPSEKKAKKTKKPKLSPEEQAEFLKIEKKRMELVKSFLGGREEAPHPYSTDSDEFAEDSGASEDGDMDEEEDGDMEEEE